jgi:hypothetical protein
MENNLKELVKSLFTDYLDVVEESDNGNLFHPTTITTCRVMKVESLDKLLNEIKQNAFKES